jgi:hypothetical protein
MLESLIANDPGDTSWSQTLPAQSGARRCVGAILVDFLEKVCRSSQISP